MAASADVLKQFLVSIAYKVDASSEKTFTKSIEGTAKVVGGFVGVALGAVTGLAFAVDKVTEKFEQLYYSAKRSGTSVRDITNFSYAVSQLGGTVEGAQGSLEAFGQTLRNSPGLRSMLAGWNINMKDWEHNGLRILKDTMRYASRLPAYRQQQIMGQFGIDLPTGMAAMAGTDAFEKQRDEKLKAMGLDPEKASRASVDMQQIFRSFGDTLSIIWNRVELAFVKAFRDPFIAFDNLVQRLGPTIAKRFDEIAEVAAKLAIQLVQGLASPEFQAWVDWITSEDTWKGWKDALVHIGDQVHVILDAAEKLAKVILWLGRGTKKVANWFTEGYEMGRNPNYPGGTDDTPTGSLGPGAGGAGGGAGGYLEGGGGPIGKPQVNANSQAVQDELRKAGYNDNAIAAILGSMQTESSFNPSIRNASGHTGLWQWDGRQRWPKIAAWIKSQGGDPRDARWQTRAWIAEHNAKPGDAIYDNSQTAAGGRMLRANPSLAGAVTGVRMSERFGVGEEGGRARHAEAWLPRVQGGGGRPLRVAVAIPPAATASAAGASAAALGIGSIGGGASAGGGTVVNLHQENHVNVKTDNHPGKIAHAVGQEMAKRHGEAVRNMTGAAQ